MAEEKKGKLENFVSKKNITAKKLTKATTILMGVVLIVFMTISNVIFDPKNLDFFKWFTNSLILVGIMVFGLLMGESVGHDKQAENVNGLFQINLNSYNVFRSTLDDIEIYFSQFYLWFKERELIRKKIEILVDNSFDGQWAKMLVLNAKKEDLVAGKLIKGEEKEKIYIKQDEKGNFIKLKKISAEDAANVQKMLDANLNGTPKETYFLSAFANGSGGGLLAQSGSLQRKIKLDKRFNRTFKIVSSLFVSLVFGMASVSDFADENAKLQAWMNLITRLTALITSFVSGWGSSVITVKTEAEIIANKEAVLRTFRKYADNGEFKPLSYEEEVAIEYDKQLQEEMKIKIEEERIEEEKRKKEEQEKEEENKRLEFEQIKQEEAQAKAKGLNRGLYKYLQNHKKSA